MTLLPVLQMHYTTEAQRADGLASPTAVQASAEIVRAVVRDEAPLVTGWRLKVRRVKASKRCARRVIIIGKATYEDNSPAAERKTWVLKLKSRAVTVARVTGSDNYGTINLEGVTCTRRLGRLTATLAIVDAAKHVTLAPPKAIEL